MNNFQSNFNKMRNFLCPKLHIDDLFMLLLIYNNAVNTFRAVTKIYHSFKLKKGCFKASLQFIR